MIVAIAITGIAVMFWGIISGNIAGNQIWDQMEQEEKSDHAMFSVSETISGSSFNGRRSDMIRKYRASYPNGNKLRKLRIAQLLTLSGAVFMILGGIISVVISSQLKDM